MVNSSKLRSTYQGTVMQKKQNERPKLLVNLWKTSYFCTKNLYHTNYYYCCHKF